MPPRSAPRHHAEKYLNIKHQSLPDSFDWRDKGAVTPVKDQGSVGSCWTFSTVGNIEGQWFLTNHSLLSLSEEQVVECDSTIDEKLQHSDCGVFGGWPYLAFEYVMKAGGSHAFEPPHLEGLESEESYPYCVGTGKCFPCMAPGYNKTLCGPPVEYCNGTKWFCHQA